MTPELHDFPLLIYDLDGDNVKDLLAPCSLFNMKTNSLTAANLQNYLVIISGKTGQIINTPLQIKMCSAIHNLMFENSSVISYTCYNSTEKGWTINKLYAVIFQ